MPEGSAPTVLSWEQLSRYRGFKAEGVEAGQCASLAMIVSHTQQVFDPNPNPDTGQDIAAQVSVCVGGGGGVKGGQDYRGITNRVKPPACAILHSYY